jgi:hypothetical protein
LNVGLHIFKPKRFKNLAQVIHLDDVTANVNGAEEGDVNHVLIVSLEIKRPSERRSFYSISYTLYGSKRNS